MSARTCGRSCSRTGRQPPPRSWRCPLSRAAISLPPPPTAVAAATGRRKEEEEAAALGKQVVRGLPLLAPPCCRLAGLTLLRLRWRLLTRRQLAAGVRRGRSWLWWPPFSPRHPTLQGWHAPVKCLGGWVGGPCMVACVRARRAACCCQAGSSQPASPPAVCQDAVSRPHSCMLRAFALLLPTASLIFLPCRASSLVLPDLAVTRLPEFKSIAVTAHLWLPLQEVPGPLRTAAQ